MFWGIGQVSLAFVHFPKSLSSSLNLICGVCVFCVCGVLYLMLSLVGY